MDCDVDRNQGRIYIFPKNFDEAVSDLLLLFELEMNERNVVRQLPVRIFQFGFLCLL